MIYGILLNEFSFYPSSFYSSENAKTLREFIVENTYKAICDNPESIPIFKKSFVHNKETFYQIYDTFISRDSNHLLVAFYDTHSHLKGIEMPVGVAVFEFGNPWYTEQTTLEEILTVSFKKGVGLAGAVADWMESYAKEEGIHLIGAACANRPFSKMVANTYKKKGFKMYPTFYKEI